MNMHAKFQIICKHRYLWTINLVSEFWEFCTKIYHAKVSLVQEDSYKIYFLIFEHSYKFLWILEVWNNFCYLKQLENTIKFRSQYWVETGPGLQTTGHGCLLRMVGRKAGWATAWQPSPTGQTACTARCNSRAARAPTRSPRADRAWDGAVACSLVAR
jgi:hypothetical protein